MKGGYNFHADLVKRTIVRSDRFIFKSPRAYSGLIHDHVNAVFRSRNCRVVYRPDSAHASITRSHHSVVYFITFLPLLYYTTHDRGCLFYLYLLFLHARN